MAKRHCAACQKVFEPHPHVPAQQYCSAPDCQKVRRRRWQQHKLKSDPDYRDNQARAQRQWQQDHPDYWRTYRQGHPDYTARNRNRQRQRNQKRRHLWSAIILFPHCARVCRLPPYGCMRYTALDIHPRSRDNMGQR
jgi:hypothetical protein